MRTILATIAGATITAFAVVTVETAAYAWSAL